MYPTWGNSPWGIAPFGPSDEVLYELVPRLPKLGTVIESTAMLGYIERVSMVGYIVPSPDIVGTISTEEE